MQSFDRVRGRTAMTDGLWLVPQCTPRSRTRQIPASGAGVRAKARPRAESVLVSVDGMPSADWTLEPGGWIVFESAPAAGSEVRSGFLFDVPVRFESDRLEVAGATFAAGEAPSVPLVEIREAT